MTDHPNENRPFLDRRCENPNCKVNAVPEPLPTDQLFSDSPRTGEPTCLCSRCLQPIKVGQVPIRRPPPGSTWEYRYHPKCLYPSNPSPRGPYEIPPPLPGQDK